MTITVVRELSDELLADVAAVNVAAFWRQPMRNVFPYLTVDESKRFHRSRSERKGYLCALSHTAGLNGYSCGFDATDLQNGNVNLEALEAMEKEFTVAREDVHYNASTATIHPRGGIGTQLVKAQVKASEKPFVLMRRHVRNEAI